MILREHLVSLVPLAICLFNLNDISIFPVQICPSSFFQNSAKTHLLQGSLPNISPLFDHYNQSHNNSVRYATP